MPALKDQAITKEAVFTVQLGAFKDVAQVGEFVQDHQLKMDGLMQYTVTVGGEQWFVLSWGRFLSRETALERSRLFSGQGIKTWVRATEGLNNPLLLSQGKASDD